MTISISCEIKICNIEILDSKVHRPTNLVQGKRVFVKGYSYEFTHQIKFPANHVSS